MKSNNLFQADSQSENWFTSDIHQSKADRLTKLLLAGALLGIIFVCLYQLFRGLSLFNPGYGWFDSVFGVTLLICELFIALHSIGYFWSILRASTHYNSALTQVFTAFTAPPVAIYLATYSEPGEIIDDTLRSLVGLDYPNLTIYLNCDSPKLPQAEMCRALAERYGVNFYHRVPNTGYKAGGINLFLERLGHDLPYAKYMIVLDADSKPARTFVSELVNIAESNDKIAFVQTPQFYSNSGSSPVALGASSMQAVFYEYICEAKHESKAMFCCGTNVLFRVEALLEVGGFDETSITEDFATSLRLHMGGWTSHYHNNTYVLGVGPETLGAYFVQQGRWALGTLSFFLRGIIPVLFKPVLTLGQKWEYFLSGTYYFTGITQIVLLICPIAFLLFGVRPLIADPVVYLSAFLPAFIFSNLLFYVTMTQRKYRIRQLLAGQALTFINFWVQAGAVWCAIIGKRKAFGVTPKGEGDPLPWIVLWPQLVFLAISIVAAVVGLTRMIVSGDLSLGFNVFWVIYHCLMLSTIFFFNRKVEIEHPEAYFNSYDSVLLAKGGE